MFFVFFKRFCFFLHWISFDIDGAEWTGGANIFTSSTTYTYFLIYMRNCQSVLIRHHRHCLRGTVFGAGSATGSISINNAIFLDENNISHLCKMFLLYTYGKNCSIGTDISTDSTVKVTKSFLKANSRLHHACQAIFHESRFQDMRRAFADTKMTGCTLLLEVSPTDRPRRSDRILLFVCLLTFQTCYRFLGLGDEFGGCSGSNKTGDQKTAFG